MFKNVEMMVRLLHFNKNYIVVPFRSTVVRYVSSNPSLKDLNNKDFPRKRFLRPKTPREFDSFRPDFVPNLFCGVFDKKFFNYPEVLRNEELSALIRHGTEIENYLSSSITITEGITHDVLKGLKNLELYGLSIPQKYGGLGYNETETKFIIECLGICPEIGRLIASNESFGINIISRFGNEEQKLKYLPKLATGENLTTFAYLEDCSLLDITSFSSFSIKQNTKEGYLINGNKKWVQNAHLADIFLIFTTETALEEGRVLEKHNIFIADKNTPGITVHELNNEHAKEFNLYNVSFKNTFLPNEALIPNDGYMVLKDVFSSYNLSCAVLCLSVLKKISFEAIQLTNETVIENKPLSNDSIQANMGFLSSYIYVLESVIYIITGRYDVHEKTDLFCESSIAKIIATDMLHLAIKKYLQIVGKEGFKDSRILREALAVLENYSILDENNGDLKKMIGVEGLVKCSSLKSEHILKIRDPFNHPVEKLKWLRLTNEKYKKMLNLNLKMELHGLLQNEANILESLLSKTNIVVMEVIARHGTKAFSDEYCFSKIAEGVIYIYALAACLSRASTMHCNFINSSEIQINMTQIFASYAYLKVNNILDHIMMWFNIPEFYKYVGEESFRLKQYPAEHPLTRTF